MQHPGAGCADGLGDPHKFLTCRREGRGGLAERGLVILRATGGEAEEAGGHAFGGESPHLRNVGRCGVLTLGTPLAHHVQTQRRMRHLRSNVHVLRAFERGEVFRQRVPVPRQAFVQRRAGDVLNAFHQLHETLVVGVVHGGEPDTTVTEHHRGDAVPRRRLHRGLPGRLAVVVGVHIDKARCNECALGVDLSPASPIHRPDLDHHAIGDRDVGGPSRRAGSIDDGAAANHQIVLSHPSMMVGTCGSRHIRGRLGHGCLGLPSFASPPRSLPSVNSAPSRCRRRW